MVAQYPDTYEAKTQEIAKQLLATTQEKKRSLFGQLQDQMRFDDKLMDWAMSNPGLRVQLFHFIDCIKKVASHGVSTDTQPCGLHMYTLLLFVHRANLFCFGSQQTLLTAIV